MKFKLGQLICKDGVEPKGIYFVKKGSCLVGLLDHKNNDVQKTPHCWFRQKNPGFTRIGNLADPSRHPLDAPE